MLAVAVTSAYAQEVEAPSRRGPFAFHYALPLSDEALRWYSRFDLLVTHDPLPAEQVRRLHAAGTKLLLYEWAVAFYDSRASKWQRSLVRRRHHGLLNDVPLTGHAGSPSAKAWYYDPAAAGFPAHRAADIARRLHAIGYDGVFLDTTTVENVHAEARQEYERRHPETPYDVAFARFLRQLRRKLPHGVLFTNQGYRSAENYLPYVDWDLTESLITAPRDGAHRLRPWNDPGDPWNSIHFVLQTMIEPLAARYPKVRFAHLNYIDGADNDAIRVAVATAQIFGGEAFVAADDPSDEMDDVYFRDPGKPLGARVDLAGGNVSYRLFEHGLIAVTAATEEVRIGDIVLPPTAGEPRAYFFTGPH